jgi:hypothetical protein
VYRLSIEPLLHCQRDGVMRLAVPTLDLTVNLTSPWLLRDEHHHHDDVVDDHHGHE